MYLNRSSLIIQAIASSASVSRVNGDSVSLLVVFGLDLDIFSVLFYFADIMRQAKHKVILATIGAICIGMLLIYKAAVSQDGQVSLSCDKTK